MKNDLELNVPIPAGVQEGVGVNWANRGQAILPTVRSLRTRFVETERLALSPPSAAQQNLEDIVRINHWFGGHRSLLQVLQKLVRPLDRFSLLDVGAASGDMGRRIRGKYKNAHIVSLDHRIIHLQRATAPKVAAEATALPFRDRSFDFVLCSLVLHHYSDECAAEMARELLRFARQALIVVDLDRHPVPYSFLPLTGWLFGWSQLTIHDGRISVAAGFKASELGLIAELAGGSKSIVRRHWPWFRISAVISPQGCGGSSKALP